MVYTMPKKHIYAHLADLDLQRRAHRRERLSMLGVVVVLPTVLALVAHLCW